MLLQVVGSQARILYSDDEGRVEIALQFNKAIVEGRIKVRKTEKRMCQTYLHKELRVHQNSTIFYVLISQNLLCLVSCLKNHQGRS